MSDCLVIGGGVIGLSIAYELAGRGRQVRVLDAAQPGREASWAGAGILPPAGSDADEPLEQLAALSNRLHAAWSAELLDTTQIDNGYRRSGAVYLARDAIEARVLKHMIAWARQRGVVVESLVPEELDQLEPELRPNPVPELAYLMPDECQIRNPRHLKALLVGCGQRGVEISPGTAAEDFELRAGRVVAVQTGTERIAANQVCITAGAWSGAVAGKLGLSMAIRPIRGQILLLATARPIVSRIVNVGGCYLVPRADGRLLVGSTEEDVGFNRATTARAASDLLSFAINLVPALGAASIERSWAGLRPATCDGMPYLGRVPGVENAFLAAGHFRGGLQLSTGTARLMSQLITGGETAIDLSPFRLDRDADAAPRESSPASTGAQS